MSDDLDGEVVHCVECGKNLNDPKNAGYPDIDGDWVCRSDNCLLLHDTSIDPAGLPPHKAGDTGRVPVEQLRIDLLNAYYSAFKASVSVETAKEHDQWARETAREDAADE